MRGLRWAAWAALIGIVAVSMVTGKFDFDLLADEDPAGSLASYIFIPDIIEVDAVIAVTKPSPPHLSEAVVINDYPPYIQEEVDLLFQFIGVVADVDYDTALSHGPARREHVPAFAPVFINREVIQPPVFAKFVLDQPFDLFGWQMTNVLYPYMGDGLIRPLLALEKNSPTLVVSMNASPTQRSGMRAGEYRRIAFERREQLRSTTQ